jgi:hypothetical protein
MIEVQHENVRLATVHTRVSQEVVDDASKVGRPVLYVVPFGVGKIRRSVALVVLAVPGMLALAAERMAPILRPVLEVELRQRLEGFTAAAALLSRLLHRPECRISVLHSWGLIGRG